MQYSVILLPNNINLTMSKNGILFLSMYYDVHHVEHVYMSTLIHVFTIFLGIFVLIMFSVSTLPKIYKLGSLA